MSLLKGDNSFNCLCSIGGFNMMFSVSCFPFDEERAGELNAGHALANFKLEQALSNLQFFGDANHKTSLYSKYRNKEELMHHSTKILTKNNRIYFGVTLM